ncbi:ABC transporter substrate-binding protein [Spirochaetia bacterium]|nr:ABC transporter substrate-binding protein [Spirochaetia bacterium]
MKKTTILFLILLLVAGSVFAGGGGQKGSGAAAPGEISGNLEFWGPDGAGANPNDPQNIWWRETIAQFRAKYPKVNMQVSSTPGQANEYLMKLTTELAAGRSPDVMGTYLTGRLQPFVEAKMVRSLKPFVDARPELKKTINPIAISYAQFGSADFYALPMIKSGEVIWYNKKIFRDNGISVPKTYDELIAISATLKNKGIIPITVGGKDVWPIAIPYMMLFERMFGLDLYKSVIVGHEAKFDDPAFAEAGRKIQEMQRLGVFSPSITAVGNDEARAEFLSGKAAMWPEGVWSLTPLLTDMGDDLGFFNFPAVSGGKGGANDWLINFDEGFAISQNAKNLPAAEAWMEFMFSPERQADFQQKGRLVASINLPVDTSKLHPTQNELSRALDGAANAYIPFDNPLGTVMGNEFNSAVQRCFAGDDPVRAFQDLNRTARLEW